MSYDGPIEHYVGGSPEGAFLPRWQRRRLQRALLAGIEETPTEKRERLEADAKRIVDNLMRKDSPPCSSPSSLSLPSDSPPSSP